MRKHFIFCFIIITLITEAQNINLQPFATGLPNITEIANANDDRLFVVQQNGLIKIVQPNGSINPAPFLNLTGIINYDGAERGLLGLAFHPQYASNGYFFVYYNNPAGSNVVARYTVNASNPNIADPATAKILLTIPKPFPNHNGGCLNFAPDGTLWISVGDGGSGNDPNNNGQNRNVLLAKMLRLDVNSSNAYNIPANNPFVGIAGADEIWAYGLRNAWKFSFDPASNMVYIADVGQFNTEEINKVPISQAGNNFGWRCYEGNNAYITSGCAAASTMTFPVSTYDHSGGKCSITGGYVYRGTNYPSLVGKYFFADFCSQQIGIMNPDNSSVLTAPFTGNSFSTFGRDYQNELYVAAQEGTIYKITTPNLSTNVSESRAISFYPNPATASIFFRNAEEIKSLEIYDTTGRKVSNLTIINANADISHLPKSTYFLKITQQNGSSTYEKLIKN